MNVYSGLARLFDNLVGSLVRPDRISGFYNHRPHRSGRGGRRFKSCHSDQLSQFCDRYGA
jgi:hypothetical protein